MSSIDTRPFWPITALEALTRWRSGQPLWSVRLLGLHDGPHREQASQLCVFEIIRRVLASKVDVTSPELLEQSTRAGVHLARTLEISDTEYFAAAIVSHRALTDGWTETIRRYSPQRQMLVRARFAMLIDAHPIVLNVTSPTTPKDSVN